LVATFGPKINFLTVYIMEAHASDTWPMGFEIELPQTHTCEQRSKVARDFVRDNDYEFTIRIDEAPANKFNELFAAWPLRFFVIEKIQGKPTMTYIHEPEGDLVLVIRLHEFLERRFK